MSPRVEEVLGVSGRGIVLFTSKEEVDYELTKVGGQGTRG